MTTLDPRALEAAAEAVGRHIHCLRHNCTRCRRTAGSAITAYLEVAQPVVKTVEGLIALGDGAVIRDRWGGLNEKRGTWWTGFGPELIRTADMANALPARVIWSPHESP